MCNFFSQDHNLVKYLAYEKKGKDHQRQNVLMFQQILLTTDNSSIKKNKQNSEENVFVHVGLNG